MRQDFKRGDYVFYITKEFGHFPTKVYKVTKKRILIDNPKLEKVPPFSVQQMIFVKRESCILQSEWEKQNQ